MSLFFVREAEKVQRHDRLAESFKFSSVWETKCVITPRDSIELRLSSLDRKPYFRATNAGLIPTRVEVFMEWEDLYRLRAVLDGLPLRREE